MNVSSKLRIGLVFIAFISATADLQATEKRYDCVVQDSAKKLLKPTTAVDDYLIEGVYAILSTDERSAQAAALALANKQHNNKAVSAVCVEIEDGEDVTS